MAFRVAGLLQAGAAVRAAPQKASRVSRLPTTSPGQSFSRAVVTVAVQPRRNATLAMGSGCRSIITGSRRLAVSATASTPAAANSPAPGVLTVPKIGTSRSAFAPATIANLGPGFDFIGAALEGQGNVVTAKLVEGRNVEVVEDSCDVSKDYSVACKPMDVVTEQAARMTLQALGLADVGLEIRIRKFIPLKSGLGGTAAAVAATVWAVNLLFGETLSKEQCVVLASEAALSGYSDYSKTGRPRLLQDARVISAARVPAAVTGGFVLLRGFKPITAVPVPFGPELQGKEIRRLWFCLVTPDFTEPATNNSNLPTSVPLQTHVENCSAGASMVAAVQAGDLKALGVAIGSDQIAEVVRGPLLPGFYAVKKAAVAAGAYGCTLSGSGPTLVAITPDKAVGMEICKAMVKAFESEGVSVPSANVVALCPTGVREFFEETDREHSRLVAFQVARELARRHRVVPPIVTGG